MPPPSALRAAAVLAAAAAAPARAEAAGVLEAQCDDAACTAPQCVVRGPYPMHVCIGGDIRFDSCGGGVVSYTSCPGSTDCAGATCYQKNDSLGTCYVVGGGSLRWNCTDGGAVLPTPSPATAPAVCGAAQCGAACESEAECNPDMKCEVCRLCIRGRCASGCGTMCTSDAQCASPSCPRCSNATPTGGFGSCTPPAPPPVYCCNYTSHTCVQVPPCSPSRSTPRRIRGTAGAAGAGARVGCWPSSLSVCNASCH